MKKLIAIAAAAIIALGAASTAAKADWCGNTVSSTVNEQMMDQWNAGTAKYYQAKAALEAAGLQDSEIYRALINGLNSAADDFHNKAQNAVDQGVEECRDGLQPAQDIVDFVISDLTLGLSEVLPERMFHVDVGEILDGNIFGGEHSIFNEVFGGLF